MYWNVVMLQRIILRVPCLFESGTYLAAYLRKR